MRITPSPDTAAPTSSDLSTGPRGFGDLLALARERWVRQMAERLAVLGYDDYRRTDALVVRRLRRGPVPIGRLGEALGVTRQAARKVVESLEQRGYAITGRDDLDARRVTVNLTATGEAYGDAVVNVIEALNQELADRVSPDQLAAASSVLRQVIGGR